jgi:hypothetical protein
MRVQRFADAQGEGEELEDPDADVFRCPEDAVSGRLSQPDLVKIMRFLQWKKVAKEWKNGEVPLHMMEYSTGKWFAPVVKLPQSKKGVWDNESSEMKLWKENARALLDMTAWCDLSHEGGVSIICSKLQAPWNDDTSCAVHRMSISDIFSVSGRTLKSASIIKLVACLGIWLNWHHQG